MSIEFHTLSVVDGSTFSRTDRIIAGLFPAMPFSATANSLTAVGSTTAGTGYTSVPTLSFNGGTGSGATAVIPSLKVVTATVAFGGTGYVTNDVVSFGNGVTLTATASAGVVTSWAITTAGAAPAAPVNPVAAVSTTGVGVGATATLTWGLNTAVLTNSGSYTVVPTSITLTGGGGSSGAVAAPTLGGAGAGIVVGVTGLYLPTSYVVQATPSVPAFVAVVYKGVGGFSVSMTPILAGSSLVAGTVDIELKG